MSIAEHHVPYTCVVCGTIGQRHYLGHCRRYCNPCSLEKERQRMKSRKQQARKTSGGREMRFLVWSPADREQIAELWNSGKSASEIATIKGATRNAIIGLCHRMGLSKPRERKSIEAKVARKRAYDQGWRAARKQFTPRPARYKPIPVPGFTVPESEWVGYFENTGCKEIMDTSTKQCCGRLIKYRSYCEGHAGQNYSVKR